MFWRRLLAEILQKNRRLFGARLLDYHRLSRKNLQLAPPAAKKTSPEK